MNEESLVRPEDRWFSDSPDAGDSSCLCSRCGKVIEEEDGPPIRIFDVDNDRERRYHPNCVSSNFAGKGPGT